jgi:hypothetical protein
VKADAADASATEPFRSATQVMAHDGAQHAGMGLEEVRDALGEASISGPAAAQAVPMIVARGS